MAPDKDECSRVELQLNDACFEECRDVNSVANCIKIWLRKLPIPLFKDLDSSLLVKADNSELIEEIIGQEFRVFCLLETIYSLYVSLILQSKGTLPVALPLVARFMCHICS